MPEMEIETWIVKLMAYVLFTRTIRLKCRTWTSQQTQGSPLSPLLFKIYMTSLPKLQTINFCGWCYIICTKIDKPSQLNSRANKQYHKMLQRARSSNTSSESISPLVLTQPSKKMCLRPRMEISPLKDAITWNI